MNVCQASAFPLNRVLLLDGPFKQAMLRDAQYLKHLDSDRLLHMFRVTAGLPSTAEPYHGWESPSCEIRGHTIGHYLSACAMMYASTADDALKKKADAIVSELARCQAAMPSQGYNSGYLFAFPESFFDRVDDGKPVWVPWYTCHKIMQGLLDMYIYCGNDQALTICTNMAAWISFRTGRLSEEQMQRSLNLEFGGMNDVLAALYQVTGNPEHLTIAKRFDHKVIFEPIARKEDRLRGLHANTQIPKIVGAAREYEVTGDQSYRDIAEFFWDQVARKRSYVIGGTSNYEHWRTEPGILAKELSVESAESCCTYNMLKLTRHLFCWQPRAEYADYYERALLNQILASQSTDNGMMMYYIAMNPGHFKIFNTPDDAFWCCTGSGMENHAKYGDSIYFKHDNTLWINLFISSELDWREQGVVLRQQTSFPEDDTTVFSIKTDQPKELDLRIRVPYWAYNGFYVTINSNAEKVTAVPSSFCSLKRMWHDGDTISVTIPMSLHLQPMPDDPSVAAVMYGPVVLAGELGTNEFTPAMQYQSNQRAMHHAPAVQSPVLITGGKPVQDWVVPVPGQPLCFKTKDVGRPRDVSLVPFYRLIDQRYTIYWDILSEKEYQQRKSLEKDREAKLKVRQTMLEQRLIDTIAFNNASSEQDHALQADRSSSGNHAGAGWRDARGGGWFSFTLNCFPDAPVSLLCTYWGLDSGRNFHVLVNGTSVTLETLDGSHGESFFDVEYPVPFELTKGSSNLTVKIEAHAGNIAGGLFGCATLKHE